jgi:hypothetical protein
LEYAATLSKTVLELECNPASCTVDGGGGDGGSAATFYFDPEDITEDGNADGVEQAGWGGKGSGGAPVEIFWDGDGVWWPAKVVRFNKRTFTHTVRCVAPPQHTARDYARC